MCRDIRTFYYMSVKKGIVIPYSLPSVGPRADHGVQTGDFKPSTQQ